MSKLRKALELLLASNVFIILFFISTTKALSDETINAYDTSSPIPLEWESVYVGVPNWSGYVAYCWKSEIHIDPFKENETSVKGTMEFWFYKLKEGAFVLAPEGCEVGAEIVGEYLCHGQVVFRGKYSERSLSLEFTHFMDDPNRDHLLSPAFTLTGYNGWINESLTEMRHYFRAKYTIPIDKDEEHDSGFIVGKETGDFGNNNNFDNTKTDFFPDSYPESWKTYSIIYFFDKLVNFAKEGEINKLQKKMRSDWEGACYGIALTMALVFNTSLSVQDISRETVDYYYGLKEKPKDNSYLRDAIHYYQLFVHLDKCYDDLIEYSTFDSDKDKWNWPFQKKVSLKKFLQELVEDARKATSNYKTLIFVYGYYDAWNLDDTHAHAILITKFKYRSKEKLYELGLYDMNGFKETTMTISGEFDWFNFIDGNNNQITQDRYDYMKYLKPEKYSKFTLNENSNVVSTNYTYVVFSKDSSFKLQSDIGLSLTYGNNEFSGDLPVFSLDFIENDIKIKTAYCPSFKIESIGKHINIDIYDNNHFKAVEGEDIESIALSIPGDIKLNGETYTFKAYTSVEEFLSAKEHGMGSIFAKGQGEVVIHPGQNTVEATAQKPMSGIKTEVYQGVDVIEGTIKGNQKKVVLKVTEDADNHNLEESGMIIFAKSGYAYKGRPIKPFVSVYVGGKSLKKNKEFKVQYENNVEVGTGKLTVTGVGEYSGSLTAEFPIIPKKVKVKKVTSCNSGFEVTWKASGPKDGFEIQYATDLDFKNVETKKIEDGESSSAQVEGLEVGGEYFVRMRAYKTEAETGITYNSNWSDVKSVLIYPN